MSQVSSMLDAVTVYAAGAVCTRRAKVEPAQVTGLRLRLTGLPLSLLAGSLRAKVLAGPEKLRVLDVRADFDVTLADELDVPVEQQALEKAQQALAHLQGELGRLDQQLSELASLRPQFPVQKKGAPPREAPVEAMLKLGTFVEDEVQARQQRRRELAQQVEDAKNEVELRRRRLQEASNALKTERVQVSRAAVITFSEPPSAAFELALEYQVPGARWVPSYELRLAKDLEKGALAMRAAVVQQTGEDWSQVKLSLSTASLDRRTDLPELKALKIRPHPARGAAQRLARAAARARRAVRGLRRGARAAVRATARPSPAADAAGRLRRRAEEGRQGEARTRAAALRLARRDVEGPDLHAGVGRLGVARARHADGSARRRAGATAVCGRRRRRCCTGRRSDAEPQPRCCPSRRHGGRGRRLRAGSRGGLRRRRGDGLVRVRRQVDSGRGGGPRRRDARLRPAADAGGRPRRRARPAARVERPRAVRPRQSLGADRRAEPAAGARRPVGPGRALGAAPRLLPRRAQPGRLVRLPLRLRGAGGRALDRQVVAGAGDGRPGGPEPALHHRAVGRAEGVPGAGDRQRARPTRCSRARSTSRWATSSS